jgi:glycosyltransferase involved in cell wall biosynthesis
MHVLIEAMKLVQKTNVHISLTIVGDGVEQDRLLGMIRSLNLEDRVRLSGKLPPDQVAAQLAVADAFVFASEREGRPNAVIEAMAAGLPVIASRIPGITDLIEDGSSGLLFDAGDANKLATHIAMIAEDAELRLRVGNAAHRAIVDRGLNWESTARRYVELYAAVVHETGQRAA